MAIAAPLPNGINNDNINNNESIILPPVIPGYGSNNFNENNKFWIRFKIGSHGRQFVAKCLKNNHNLVEITKSNLPSKECIFYWVQRENFRDEADIIVKKLFNNNSLISHVPSQAFLCDKAKFGEIMYQYYGNLAWNYTPLTYHINYKPTTNTWNLGNLSNANFNDCNNDVLWIVKTSGGSVGKGMHVFKGKNIETLNKFLLDKLNPEKMGKTAFKNKNGEIISNFNYNAVIQAYIDKPLLYNGKFKFDLRIYTLIAATNPCILFYYRGKQRLCATEYSNNIDFNDINYKFSHLTNCKIQRKHVDFDSHNSTTNGNSMLNDWDTLIRWFYNISVIQKKFNKDWFGPEYKNRDIDSITMNDIRNIVDKKCKKLCKIAYNCVGTLFDNDYMKYKRHGQFCFHGVDIIIDNSGKFYFLEVNRAPTMSLNGNDNIINSSKSMLLEMINIVMEIRSKRLKNIPINQNTALKSVKNWQQIKLDYKLHYKYKWNKSIDILNELINIYSKY